MIPFNNELQIGQPAMVINVENKDNIDKIGKTVMVLDLMSLQESKDYFLLFRDERVNHPYAVIDDGTLRKVGIRQDYLMPLPPLGDVYADEMTDVLENLKVTCP